VTGLISTNTFWTLWLFVHLILAVGLLGALTHQAMAAALPVRQAASGIVTRFRAVPAIPHLHPHPARGRTLLQDRRLF